MYRTEDAKLAWVADDSMEELHEELPTAETISLDSHVSQNT